MYGKTTLTESLLYTSGAIAEQRSVDETVRTDTMIWSVKESLSDSSDIFSVGGCKVNIIDANDFFWRNAILYPY